MRLVQTLIGIALTTCGGCLTLGAEDFEKLSSSPVWQVRYCVSGKLTSADTASRGILERLAMDETSQVARQAFAHYSRRFVKLSDPLVEAAFARGDFDLVGVNVPDRKVFETPEFWIADLKNAAAPDNQARSARAIGMCGTRAHIEVLSEYTDTTNPYLLIELALAFHRLGDTEKYLATLDSMLALPIRDAFYYQSYAIDCLIQTHPQSARTKWKQVHEQFEKEEELQPNWVYAHIVQENRLPKPTSKDRVK